MIIHDYYKQQKVRNCLQWIESMRDFLEIPGSHDIFVRTRQSVKTSSEKLWQPDSFISFTGFEHVNLQLSNFGNHDDISNHVFTKIFDTGT